MSHPEGPPNVAELTIPEVVARHTALLRHLQESCDGAPPLLRPANLQGIALDIGYALDAVGFPDTAGVSPLTQNGVEAIYSVSVPEPQLFEGQEKNPLEERRMAQSRLVAALRDIQSLDFNLVTVFDHWGDLLSQKAVEEIKRLLAPGGQCLITVRDRVFVPNARLPNMGNTWHLVGEEFAPNAAVCVFSK